MFNRKTAVLGGLLILGLGLGAVPGLTASSKESAKPESPAKLYGLVKPSTSTAFMEGAAFAGSAACANCHADKHAQWEASGHANMLRPLSAGIVKADFSGAEIAYEGVEVEDAQKNKVKISPKVKPEVKDGKYYVTLLDPANPENSQSFEVVEVLGSLWEQQYYLKAGETIFPSPVRWVEADKQWRKAPFAAFWWNADASPKKPAELPAKQSVDYQCNGCHTTGFSAKKDEQGKYAFSRQEGGIGCESCHGPGSKHIAAGGGRGSMINPAKLGTWQQEQLCGQCHSRVTSKQDKDFAFPLGFKPGQTDLQDRVEFWTYSTKPGNFWGNEDAKKNRQQYHDTMRSAHMQAGLTCSACHLDHATQHVKSSLKMPREQICSSCHQAQKAMFEDSRHAKQGLTCVDCHMAKQGNRAGATAKTPKEPFDVSGHTMRAVTPSEAQVFKMRSSCEKCHKDESLKQVGAKFDTLRQEVQSKLAVTQAKPGQAKLSANLEALRKDAAFGAHNPEKALKMLEEIK